MKHSYASHLQWEKGEKTDHTMDLNLQLNLDDLLDVRGDVVRNLLENEQRIRTEIFTLVVGNVVPTLIANTPIDSRLPDGVVDTTYENTVKASHQVGHPKNGQGSVRYKGAMDIHLDMHVSKPLNAMQVLNANRETVAHEVTNTVINSLRHRYLGETANRTQARSEMQNGVLKLYEANVQQAS